MKYDLGQVLPLLPTIFPTGHIREVNHVDGGSAECYRLMADQDFFLKLLPRDAYVEGLQIEADLRDFLLALEFPTSPVLRTKTGAGWAEVEGCFVQIQKFILGRRFSTNSMNSGEMVRLCDALASCCGHLKSAKNLPEFHVSSWFSPTKGDRARDQLRTVITTLENTVPNEHEDLIPLFQRKLELMTEVEQFDLDMNDFTRSGVHGDFNCLQVIEDEIGKFIVIDFAKAGIAPLSWEVMRAYCVSSADCVSAEIKSTDLADFLERFVDHFPLSRTDIEKMIDLYLFQLARSNFGIWQAHQSSFKDSAAIKLGTWRAEMALFLAANRNNLVSELQDRLFG